VYRSPLHGTSEILSSLIADVDTVMYEKNGKNMLLGICRDKKRKKPFSNSSNYDILYIMKNLPRKGAL
jgi:hypothetical protein